MRLMTTLPLLLLALWGGEKDVFPQAEARLLRFPTIYENQIVFSYAGDLYTVPASGGTARKLTTDIGYEMFARFSPDGKTLAFTGQYDGNTEVYSIPAEGGIPKRLTYTATVERDEVSDRMGPNNIVMGWKNQRQIIFRSKDGQFSDFKGRLLLASVAGGLPEELPLPRGGFCSYSPDQRKLAYNRVFREFRTWKRYRGGQADDIWIYDFDTKTTTNLTNNPAQDIIPMWSGNKIYFLSDRDENRRMNLYVVDLDSKKTKPLTHFTEFDIKFPSLGNRAIVFENGGYLYRMDLSSEKAEKVPIYIHDDLVWRRGGLIDVSKRITNFEIAPDGSRALFGARGEIFTVPAKYGNTRNLTNSSGIHERNSKWSPDGKWIAYISDASGEEEIYVMPQDGSTPGRPLTHDADTYKYALLWSPDSKKILWSDKKLRLQFVDLETEKVTLVAKAKAWEFEDFNWSPDSQWITYAQIEEDKLPTVYLYSLETQRRIEVTDGWFASSEPAFSSDGKFLFFASNRNFSPTFGQTDRDFTYRDLQKIYLVTLDQTAKSPFAPKSDEVKITTPNSEEPPAPEKKKESEPKKSVTVKVDEAGLKDRIIELPITASSYRKITSAGDQLYYVRQGSKDEKPKLLLFELDKQKETELGEITGYELSANGKKMIIGQQDSYAIIDLPTSRLDPKDRLKLSDLKMNLDRFVEWKQIYNECWRQMRDFFYAPNMNGVDWAGVRKTYEPLLEHVGHRADLDYIIGEMIGELNSGHAYVGGGDMPKVERIRMGLLGARIEQDPASHYYRIVEILPGQNWDRKVRSPLTEVGVEAHRGDYILAIDGKPTSSMTSFYQALVNTVDKQVRLKLNSQPKEEGSREVVVIPIADESPLYYYEWVEKNVEKVSQATGGKVGYIHIPNMRVEGLNEFIKFYYPQLRKEGLILDVRGNGGGNISPLLIEKLRREIALFGVARNTSIVYNPGGLVLGPKVCLLDEFSASDGDLFPYRFRHYNLGKLIGKRSWGGVIGIRGTLPIIDGGYLNRPEFSVFDLSGKEWVIEGHGVDPDIVVDNDPAKEYAGIDQQLDKAIAIILEEMKKQPVKLPAPPTYPDKRK
ncbi:MAG: PDZ domain-containing protein [Terriglobia bacterium]